MRATVSLRGSRSPRTVKRDATPFPAGSDPQAGLSFVHANGTRTDVWLTYTPLQQGRVLLELFGQHSSERFRNLLYQREIKV